MTIRRQILALGAIAVAFTLLLAGALFIQASRKASALSRFDQIGQLLIACSELANSMTNEVNASWNAWTEDNDGRAGENVALFTGNAGKTDAILKRVFALRDALDGSGEDEQLDSMLADFGPLPGRLQSLRAKVIGPQREANNWPTTQEYEKEVMRVVAAIPVLSGQTTNGDLLRRMVTIATLVGFKQEYTAQAGAALYWLENDTITTDACAMSSAFLATARQRMNLLAHFSAPEVRAVIAERVDNADLQRFLSVCGDVVATAKSDGPRPIDTSKAYYESFAQSVKALDAGVDAAIDFAAAEIRDFTRAEIEQAQWARWQAALVGIACLVACGGLGLFFASRITATVRGVSLALDGDASLGREYAEQVSDASQRLADGGSRQAAAIEEVSASMTEMESTAKLNLESLERVLQLGHQATAEATAGNEEMRQLANAMSEMSASSRQIAEIAKTIEEIAFQTNILALNAAVEAARAGVAGAGFAVVADEVRNLAQKSAVSASSTRERINDAIRRVELGEAMTRAAQGRLSAIQSNAQNLKSEIEEVSAASRQQTSAMEQIARAIAEIDRVTQSNAAASEELASTAHLVRGSAGEILSKTRRLEQLCGASNEPASTPRAHSATPRPPNRSSARASVAPRSSRVAAFATTWESD